MPSCAVETESVVLFQLKYDLQDLLRRASKTISERVQFCQQQAADSEKGKSPAVFLHSTNPFRSSALAELIEKLLIHHAYNTLYLLREDGKASVGKGSTQHAMFKVNIVTDYNTCPP